MRFSKRAVLLLCLLIGGSSWARYLEPEPLLQNPRYVRAMAQSGLAVPVYAYAANNPLMFVDRDGRKIGYVDPRLLPYLLIVRSTDIGEARYDALASDPFVHNFYWDPARPGRSYTAARTPNACGNSFYTRLSAHDGPWYRSVASRLFHEMVHQVQFSEDPDMRPTYGSQEWFRLEFDAETETLEWENEAGEPP